MRREPRNLEQLLSLVCEAQPDRDRVSLGAITDAVGRRSFGSLLLLSGLIVLSPIGDVPGTPTIMAALIITIAAQLLVGRHYFWLPRWLLKRSVDRGMLLKTLTWLRRPARFVDRFIRPRLRVFVEGRALWIIGFMCGAIALALPPMEFVPFTASGAGAALTAYGLALIAHDGLLALFAFAITASAIAAVAFALL